MFSDDRCVDVDECQSAETCPLTSEVCHNSFGSYNCTCASGYSLSEDGSCVDENECLLNNGDCEYACDNLPASFACRCPSLIVDAKLCRQYAQVELIMLLKNTTASTGGLEEYIVETLVNWMTNAGVIPEYTQGQEDVVVISVTALA